MKSWTVNSILSIVFIFFLMKIYFLSYVNQFVTMNANIQNYFCLQIKTELIFWC